MNKTIEVRAVHRAPVHRDNFGRGDQPPLIVSEEGQGAAHERTSASVKRPAARWAAASRANTPAFATLYEHRPSGNQT
ncbi:MAG: hypothetical protein E6G97_25320 [Alphaproteobacteria bacterium]|nr:MAG: hypothetical protein E6G97_25320 [Alphaproteobacteria bacterium]